MALLTNDIYVGDIVSPTYHFQNPGVELGSYKGSFALDVIGNELSIDQFSVVVRPDDNVTDIKNFLKELPYGAPVWWYVGEEFYAKGYLKSVDRISKNGFKITCTSGVGLLDTVMHVGGLYQATAITTVLSSIIGGAFTYTVSQTVQASARVYGHLPYDTCRNNLHRLLFATGAALLKGDDTTDYIIDYLSETITDVPSSRVAMQGSVGYQLPSNRVEITEHSFFHLASSPTETLFDNTTEAVASNLTIVFDTPVYVSSLATTGNLTLVDSGINYAVVSGQGTLTGQYYTHTTQVDVLENNPNNDPIRVRRVTENELITALNARNVQRRVLSYYQSAKTVKAKILTDGEQCGQLIRMTDSFGDITQGYMSKMDALVTSVIGVQCQLVEGFQPGQGGNNFLHREAFTENGTWTVPEGVTFIRIALIGGGTGGQGGYDGQTGAGMSEMTLGGEYIGDYYYYIYAYANAQQRQSAGGNPGNKGQQGKVYVIEKTVAPGEVISFAVGAGGSGGTRNGGVGTVGTPTTASSTSIGSVSSESGLASQGYFDPFNGEIYAYAGENGIAGAGGGRTDTNNLCGWSGGNGLPGVAIDTQNGGSGGSGMIATMAPAPSIHCPASGGGGGGAAYGANGGTGGSASYNPGHWENIGDGYYRWISGSLNTGAGGAGANAVAPTKPTYGCGGSGGNGGGGGGNAGGGEMFSWSDWNVSEGLTIGAAGAGGQGSVGGAGGDGIAIVYY